MWLPGQLTNMLLAHKTSPTQLTKDDRDRYVGGVFNMNSEPLLHKVQIRDIGVTAASGVFTRPFVVSSYCDLDSKLP